MVLRIASYAAMIYGVALTALLIAMGPSVVGETPAHTDVGLALFSLVLYSLLAISVLVLLYRYTRQYRLAFSPSVHAFLSCTIYLIYIVAAFTDIGQPTTRISLGDIAWQESVLGYQLIVFIWLFIAGRKKTA